jgi:hypothetical protein
MDATTLAERGILSFAIWDILDAAAVQSSSSSNSDVQANLGTIEGDAAAALIQAQDPNGYVPNFELFYPASGNPLQPQIPPGSQRYIELVPDRGMTLMLLGGALLGLEALRRKLRV